MPDFSNCRLVVCSFFNFPCQGKPKGGSECCRFCSAGPLLESPAGSIAPMFQFSCFLSSHCQSFQSRHPKQIVSSSNKVSPGLRSVGSTVATSPHPAYRFDPAKDFFDPLADSQAGLVTSFGRRARIQPRNFHSLLARHVRRDLPLPTAFHENSLMVALIGP